MWDGNSSGLRRVEAMCGSEFLGVEKRGADVCYKFGPNTSPSLTIPYFGHLVLPVGPV
jgi:hypothetical protein